MWSLARTASAVDVEPTVASTLSLMVSTGGGDQDVGEVGGIVCTSRLCRLENSATLHEMRLLDERMSILLSSKVNWFLKSQILSRVNAKVVVMCSLSTSRAEGIGGLRNNFMISMLLVRLWSHSPTRGKPYCSSYRIVVE